MLRICQAAGRCGALSLTPGMMGRGPGAPLGPVCSVTNDNLSLLPLPHNCDTAPRCSQCWPRSQHQSPHQNCNRALVLPTLSTLSAAQNEVSVFMVCCRRPWPCVSLDCDTGDGVSMLSVTLSRNYPDIVTTCHPSLQHLTGPRMQEKRYKQS